MISTTGSITGYDPRYAGHTGEGMVYYQCACCGTETQQRAELTRIIPRAVVWGTVYVYRYTCVWCGTDHYGQVETF